MRKRTVFLTGLILFLTLLVMSGTGLGADGKECNPKSNTDFCIEDVSISDQQVTQGEEVVFTVTVENVGNETGDAVILLGIQQPEGGYTYAKAKTVHDLSSGETQEVDIPTTTENSGPAGPHDINVMLFDTPQQHLYDATGYYHTVVINEDSLDVFKWIAGLNNFARALVAIAAIAGALVGKRFL